MKKILSFFALNLVIALSAVAEPRIPPVPCETNRQVEVIKPGETLIVCNGNEYWKATKDQTITSVKVIVKYKKDGSEYGVNTLLSLKPAPKGINTVGDLDSSFWKKESVKKAIKDQIGGKDYESVYIDGFETTGAIVMTKAQRPVVNSGGGGGGGGAVIPPLKPAGLDEDGAK